MYEPVPTQHKPGKTIAYHLLPGVVILAAYLLVTSLTHRRSNQTTRARES